MTYENPNGAIFLHNKEQFSAMCCALSTINSMLNAVDQSDFEDNRLDIEVKAVTKNCFRIEVGGLLNVSDEEINEALNG